MSRLETPEESALKLANCGVAEAIREDRQRVALWCKELATNADGRVQELNDAEAEDHAEALVIHSLISHYKARSEAFADIYNALKIHESL